MAAEDIRTPATTLEFEAGIARCRLERPDRGNALSTELVRGVADALAQACARADVHTLLLHGAGRHFCTGFDLARLPDETDASLLARFVEIELLLDALWRAPVRTVALAHGALVGAGADLFAACDVRLLHPDAWLRFPGAGFGIVLGSRRLACRVGASRALRWVAEATRISATEALTTGLATAVTKAVNEVHDVDTLALRDDPGVRPEILAALRAAIDSGAADADLAALVRSAAKPGLKARIELYLTRTAAQRGTH